MFSSTRKSVCSLLTCGTFYISSISALLSNSSPCLALRIPLGYSSKFATPNINRWLSNTRLAGNPCLRGGAAMSSMSNQEQPTVGEKKSAGILEVDAEYPGTAVQRLKSVHARVAQLTRAQLDADWPSVRRSILWAGQLLPHILSEDSNIPQFYLSIYILSDATHRRIPQVGCATFRMLCRAADTPATPSTTTIIATLPPCSTTLPGTRTAGRHFRCPPTHS